MRRRDLSRQRPHVPRRTRTRILIACGGVKTEPSYFKGLSAYAGNTSVDVTIVARAKSLAQIVSFALKHRDRASVDFDEVRCILDVDEFDLTEAVRLAGTTGVRLGVSNPCFEPGVVNAVGRARDLDDTGEDHRRNPSTSVWRLAERILAR